MMSLIIYVNGGIGGTGFLWINFIPVFTILILNYRESKRWIAVYTVFIILILLYHFFRAPFLRYSREELIQSFVVYLLFLYLTGNNQKLNEIVRARLETENLKLTRMSRIDSLTGLFNRDFFNRILNSEYSRFERYGDRFSLIMLDIDHFKKVNDTYGHQQGDTVLIALADTLKNNTRKTDSVGRWGGEEFLILCAATSADEAATLAEKLRKFIESMSFEMGFIITASFGVAEIRKGYTVKSLISETDTLLYESKHCGRNRVTLQNQEQE